MKSIGFLCLYWLGLVYAPAQSLMSLNTTPPNFVNGTGFPVDYTNGEIAAYWFNGTANDMFSTNNSVPMGGVYYTNGFNTNQAIHLNGSSQYLTVGTNGNFANFTNNPFSITAWIKLGALGGIYILADSGNYSIATGYLVYVGNSGNFVFQSNSGGGNLFSTNRLTTTNAWYFVAATYSGSTTNARVYVNGVIQGDKAMAAFAPSTTYPFYIGVQKNNSGFSDYFNGDVCDYRVWNTNLASGVINQLYENGPL